MKKYHYKRLRPTCFGKRKFEGPKISFALAWWEYGRKKRLIRLMHERK